MGILTSNLERRQFLTLSSMALGATVLPGSPTPLHAQAISSDASPSATDGTKYGKYIRLAENGAPTERGQFLFPIYTELPGFSIAIIGRMLPPGPMPGHDAPEKHEDEIELLIHLGNNPTDPLDLGADVDFFLGQGPWQEHYTLNRTTAVYLPHGMWHCPWKVQKVRTDVNWVNLRIGKNGQGIPGMPPGGAASGAPPASDEGAESHQERAKAKTTGTIFNKYLLSGAPKNLKDPEGGRWIVYSDCTMIDSGLLMRIIRYSPDRAPYQVIDAQAHEYPTMLLFLGTDLKDCTDLGAEVELFMGPEKEKHVINKSAMVYVPAGTVHGPFKVTKATKPFTFLEVVAGPELPGAVYGPGGTKVSA
jgi:hypothetical protein